MKTVTLRDIAEKLGCSRSTVSYALKNQACVSEEMRRKVQTLAKEMGWQPNAELAKQLSLVRTNHTNRKLPNLAVVLNKPVQELAIQLTPAKHLAGVRARAVSLGYAIEVFNLADKQLSPARLLGVLQARGVQGVVFIATAGPGSTLSSDYLQLGVHFASSVVGVRYSTPPYHVAIQDLLSAGHLAVTELLKEGFKRPGAVLPRGLEKLLSWGFSGGLTSGFFEQPEKDRVPILCVGTDEVHVPEQSFPSITAWIKKHRPDVLISTDARFMRRYLDQAEPRIRSLKVCTLDYHPSMEVDYGVDQLTESVGAAAVDLVVGQLHRGEKGIPKVQRTVQIEGTWLKLARAPAARA